MRLRGRWVARRPHEQRDRPLRLKRVAPAVWLGAEFLGAELHLEVVAHTLFLQHLMVNIRALLHTRTHNLERDRTRF